MHEPPAGPVEEPHAAQRMQAGPGLLDGAGELFRELRGIAHDYAELAALETKRAGRSLVVMLAAGVMIALLVVSAWLGLVAAAVFGMVAAGLAPAFAILIAVVANLLVAAGLFFVIRSQQRHLAFPATVRNLRPSRRETAHGGLH